MRYAIVIERTDNNFSAYVPDLPGCVATGATVAETEAAIREALADTGAATAPSIDGRLLTRHPFEPDAAPPGASVPHPTCPAWSPPRCGRPSPVACPT